MPEGYGPRSALAAAALAVLGVTALTACGHSAGFASGPAGAASPSVTPSAGVAADTGQARYTAAQLRRALLTAVDGHRPAAPAQSGAYGTLPAVRTSRQRMAGVTVRPAICAQAAATGFSSGAFTAAPAALVTFRAGSDGVSEVLVAAPAQAAATALAERMPAGCEHYSATVSGRTFRYTVRQEALAGPGTAARALNVRAQGYTAVNVWSVVFRGAGLLGAVTVVGPDSTRAAVLALAREAYARAARSLS